MNTKLHRENVNASVRCYSAKPPLLLSHSTYAVSSPSAIVRTDKRMPLPVSAAHTQGTNQGHTPGILWMVPWNITVQMTLASTLFFPIFDMIFEWFFTLCFDREDVGCVYDVILLQPPKRLYGSAAGLIGQSSQQQLYRLLLQLGLMLCIHCCFISYI